MYIGFKKITLIILSIVVALTTTFLMTNPASTITKEDAQEDPGISLTETDNIIDSEEISGSDEVPAVDDEEKTQEVFTVEQENVIEEETPSADTEKKDEETINDQTLDQEPVLQDEKPSAEGETQTNTDLINEDTTDTVSENEITDDTNLISEDTSVTDDAAQNDQDNTEETSEEIQYPFMSFNEIIDDSIVYVEAPEGALPDKTVMLLSAVEVDDTFIENIESTLTNQVVNKVKAIDISFRYNDEEIQPELPIKVSISSLFMEENDEEAKIMHIDDEGQANAVDTMVLETDLIDKISEENDGVLTESNTVNEVSENNTVVFETDSFSVYAIVYVKTVQIEADGGTYNISVSYTDEAMIPEGSVLSVREIKEGTVEYDKYLYDSSIALGKEIDNISFARFFDIEILKDGEKIEPAVPVEVKITYNDKLNINDEQSLDVVHFVDEENTEIISDVAVNNDSKSLTYQQASFSITGTIVTDTHFWYSQYVLVMELNDENNVKHYYVVLNDGSLDEVQSFSPSTGTIESIVMDRAMIWTFFLHEDNQVIYHNTDAAMYDSNELAIAECIIREYIDPSVVSGDSPGLSRDNKTIHYTDDNKPYIIRSNVPIVYSDKKITKTVNGTTYYLGATADHTRITGVVVSDSNPVTNAPAVYTAAISEPNGAHFTQQSVNHIDIAINGKASLNYPLQRGVYYDQNGNQVVIDEKTIISMMKNVGVTVEDIKKADLTAYKINNGQVEEVPNAFYITGYSTNASTEISYPQVRIEGAFKISTIAPYDMNYYKLGSMDWHEEDLYYNTVGSTDPKFNEFKQMLADRLNNRVYYSVSTTKTVPFHITIDYAVDDEGHESGTKLYYDAAHTDPVSVSVPVTLSASFDYWDPKNECPAIVSKKYESPEQPIEKRIEAWKAGCVTWGTNSGMDFILGGKNTQDSLAIEITKFILDDNGHRIQPADPIVQEYDVYQGPASLEDTVISPVAGSNVGGYTAPYGSYDSYNYVRTKELTVGTDGVGIAYDYKVNEGMVYVEEHRDDQSIPDYITDVNNYIWQYDHTHTETEYVKRGDTQLANHFSETVNKSSGTNAYKAIPEIVGHYTSGSTQAFNDYLDFFIYNVYVPKKYPVNIKKIDSDTSDTLAGAEFTLYGPYEAETPSWKADGKALTASGEDGIVDLEGLETGIYYLEETKSPAGYNLLTKPIIIKVDSRNETSATDPVVAYKFQGDSSFTAVAEQSGIYLFDVGNNAGVELPMTGGSGVVMYYVLGSMIVVSSAVLLKKNRKRNYWN